MRTMREIIDLDLANKALIERLAAITLDAFRDSSPGWIPTIDLARDQVLDAASNGRFARVITEGGQPSGWIGIIPGRRVWEIHPIAVALDLQNSGLGRLLVEDTAQLASRAGALTLFASTSDEVGTTNLFGVDLYIDPASAIRELEPIGRNPFVFWERAGFKVVGVLPDAEGRGKPSIQLARRL